MIVYLVNLVIPVQLGQRMGSPVLLATFVQKAVSLKQYGAHLELIIAVLARVIQPDVDLVLAVIFVVHRQKLHGDQLQSMAV